ncbi:MAG: TetR/AcrR family transcriptional regulator [Dehalococcoidia bacterium]|nr:TetR/AcrR family transcriptional regulator [Dehalococcoidia bacterium]
MNGFERRKEKSKENIRLAANELFGRFGIDRVTINDIAEKAGVSPVTIYNHFGSKQDLIKEFVRSVTSEFLQRLEKIVEEEKPYEEKLEDVFHAMLEVQEKDPGGEMDLVRNIHEVTELLDEVTEKTFDLFARLVNEGKKQGRLSPDFSDDATRAYFELMMTGIKANHELHARTHRDPKLFRDFMLLILYGFAGQRRPSPHLRHNVNHRPREQQRDVEDRVEYSR